MAHDTSVVSSYSRFSAVDAHASCGVRIQRNTIGEPGRRRARTRWWRRWRWRRRRREGRERGDSGGGGGGGAHVHTYTHNGGRWEILQKARQSGPFRRAAAAGGGGGGGGGAERGLGRGRTTSTMIRQKIRCTAIGCSQFELLASPVAVRQSLPDLLDTLSLSLFLFSSDLSYHFPSAAAAATATAAAATATAISSVEPPSPLSPPSGMGAGEKGRKNFEKKIQFRCHGDRRALTLIKIPRTSHLRFSASSASFSSVSCAPSSSSSATSSSSFSASCSSASSWLGLGLPSASRRRLFRSFSDCTHARPFLATCACVYICICMYVCTYTRATLGVCMHIVCARERESTGGFVDEV